MSSVRFELEASEEFIEAADWYDEQAPGLGDDFLAGARGSALALPTRLVHRALDDYQHLDVKIARLGRWPYHLIYVVKDDVFVVIASAHDRRRPGYWLDRLNR